MREGEHLILSDEGVADLLSAPRRSAEFITRAEALRLRLVEASDLIDACRVELVLRKTEVHDGD